MTQVVKSNFKHWAIEQHDQTNHYYDENLPYSFHLKLVVSKATRFKAVWQQLYGDQKFPIMYNACWGHDLMEDARVTYNDIVKFLTRGSVSEYDTREAKQVAEIIRACTVDIRGRNRDERQSASYYVAIRETPGAIFVKLCDRIANVEYGKLVGSSMYDKYREENKEFLKKLGLTNTNETYTTIGETYRPMVQYLYNLLELHQ